MILEVEKSGIEFKLCDYCPPSAGKYVSKRLVIHPCGFGHVSFTNLSKQLEEGARPIRIKQGNGIFNIKYNKA